ncbi:MAG: aspartate aminotransferase family protein [Campylobacterales bacterium]
MTLWERDQAYVLHTYSRTPINFVRGDNATLWDDEGRDYIDFTSGIAVTSVGHGNARLARAIAEQAASIIHISNLYLIEPQAKLAERLASLSGYPVRSFFANSGAEANEGAIKIARKYGEVEGEPKRYKIITLKHSFHGRTITTLKATGQEKMHNYFGPFPDGFVYASSIEEVENLLDDHTVAVMIELIQGEGGVEAMSKEAVQKLAKTLKERDILLIIDEVQTGVWRTGEFLASNLYEIEPDVITLAKGLGGGVPIGAIMTRLVDIFLPGDHGSTFGGNYLSTRAALEVLDILEEEAERGAINEVIIRFEEELKKIVEVYPSLFNATSGLGLLRGLRCHDEEIVKKVITAAQAKGLLLLKAGRATVRIAPALTISRAEIDEGFKRLHAALASL